VAENVISFWLNDYQKKESVQQRIH